MSRILRSLLVYAALLASVAFGLSGCVVVPYDDGPNHYRRYDGGHHHHHWGDGRRW